MRDPYYEKFDFELELAMVVGRRGKNIPRSEASRYIAGYTIWNDFSARDQQMGKGRSAWAQAKARISTPATPSARTW